MEKALLLMIALAWLVRTMVELRLFGFARVSRGAAPLGQADPKQLAVGRRYARYLELVSRPRFMRAHCLQRSLALQRWLRARGWASELRIGVRRHEGTIKAHAWIEMDGFVINDDARSVRAFTALSGLYALNELQMTGGVGGEAAEPFRWSAEIDR
jgi:hypothetical protein